MKRKILLSESISVNAILQQCDIGVCSSFNAYTTKEEHYYNTKQDGWNFNPDMLVCFVDETELYSPEKMTGGMAGTIPFIIGGTDVYVRIKKMKIPFAH
ncbi:MAG: hypothetical protein LBH00_08075 [Planctomycetaceae bacterium]|jgi:hypothetical protein|nr:hypothetical protein [Planctomycetaceae bacterium]